MATEKFLNRLFIWTGFALVLWLINGWTLKSNLVHNLIGASLGVFLIFKPFYPVFLWERYDCDDQKCRRIIRLIGAVEVVFFLSMQTNFLH